MDCKNISCKKSKIKNRKLELKKVNSDDHLVHKTRRVKTFYLKLCG